MSDWAELDALVAELRGANPEWAKRLDERETESKDAGQIATQIAAEVERHVAELGVREALEMLARQALADMATLHEARGPFGYTRTMTLVWRSADDPRPELAATQDARLTLEVSIGPRMLLPIEPPPGDTRLTVAIIGEKRLIATLPTTREKFRAALLRAFAAPARLPTSRQPAPGAEGEPRAEGGGFAEQTGEQPAAAPAEMAATAGAAQTSANGAEASATAEAPVSAPAAETRDQPAADKAGTRAETPDVIELPGATPG